MDENRTAMEELEEIAESEQNDIEVGVYPRRSSKKLVGVLATAAVAVGVGIIAMVKKRKAAKNADQNDDYEDESFDEDDSIDADFEEEPAEKESNGESENN